MHPLSAELRLFGFCPVADELDRQAAEIATLTAECERLRENYEFALARVPTNRRQADGPDHRRPGPWTMVKRG